jgi:NADH-quinone oxidoreductase subunit F
MAKKKMMLDDLKAIKANVAKDKEKYRLRAHVCGDTGCQASGHGAVWTALFEQVKKHGLEKEIQLVKSGCNGFCSVGPLMTIFPGGIFYQKLTAADMSELVEQHFKQGKPVERLMYKDPLTGKIIPEVAKIPFFTHQYFRVMRHMGQIDPESLDEYIWKDGYLAANKALREMSSAQIIAEMKTSRLRGRGGAGFPTGMKWEFAAASEGDVKFVLCNADEGDPGAFMDRSVMEATPHAVLEGMIVASKAINSHQGYIYCRAEYPLAVKRLTMAIEQARSYGLLGKDILGSGHDFDVEIYQGAGAFVCGEETALMVSLEGRRGMPRPRPPFPAVSGLWQKPSILNNVETFANVPQILMEGGEVFAKIGTEGSKGTKVFALTGKVNNIGLVEVPMGTPIGKIIFDIGGGIPGGKKFKAAQLGGPSGGCIPAEHLNTPTDYEAITKVGAIMGSGGMIVMDEDNCMVDMARYFMDFCQDESCGKCTPCRVGTRRMLEILEHICKGEGKEGDIELLEEMATLIKDSALCGLGQTAPNPILSTIRYFRHEYEAHIKNQYCPSGVCKGLSAAPCQRSCPAGVDVPAYNSLIAMGRFQEAVEVIRQDNPFPAVCGRLCSRPCEGNCIQIETGEAVAIRSLKRFVADYEMAHWKTAVIPTRIIHPEKIAVIGSGPAGLTAACDLRREGYAVTVLEAASRPGGMLRLAIPDFRLPQAVLDHEIQTIVDSGVEIRTGVTVGKDLTLAGLRQQGFQAILIAIGSHQGIQPRIPGSKSNGSVRQAIDFLKEVKLGQRSRLSGDVLVMGSTYAALDSARTALRLGAASVGLIYPRARDQFAVEKAEVQAAEEEGVIIHPLLMATEVIQGKDRVTGVKCLRLAAQVPDRTGRARAVVKGGEEVVLPAQIVIFAEGQAPDLSVLAKGPQLKRTPLGLLEVNPVTLETSQPGVFAAGDVTTGGATVIEAIAAGQKAAVTIHRSLRGLEQVEPHRLVKPRRLVQFVELGEAIPNFKRPQEMERPASERAHDFEEENLTYSERLAMNEARRCLRCGRE